MRFSLYSSTLVLLILIVFTFTQKAHAQQIFHLSFDPAYYIYNSDQFGDEADNSHLTWAFGGSATMQTDFGRWPVTFSVGYQQGSQAVHSVRQTIGTGSYDYELIYRSLPVEILLRREFHDRITLSGGINLVGQHRITRVEGLDIADDRLMSFGAGVSGRAQFDLTANSDSPFGFLVTLKARWTPFLFHDAGNRHLDDFNLQHVVITPGLAISYNFAQR